VEERCVRSIARIPDKIELEGGELDMKSVAIVEKDGDVGGAYPWIGISTNSNGLVVLFHEEGKGVVINVGTGSSCWELGTNADDWAMRTFKPYTGKITLEN
jgi:hypothetical protein